VVPPLTEAVARAATRFADPPPTSVAAVAATRRLALEVCYGHDPETTPPDDRPVYAVGMTGRFESNRDGPGARKPPRICPYLTVIIDAATFELSDFAVGDRGPTVPLSLVGPVTELSW